MSGKLVLKTIGETGLLAGGAMVGHGLRSGNVQTVINGGIMTAGATVIYGIGSLKGEKRKDVAVGDTAEAVCRSGGIGLAAGMFAADGEFVTEGLERL